MYIAINFDIDNTAKSYDCISGATAIIENPLLYVVNRNVLSATFRILKYTLKHEIVNVEKPPMSRDEFWNYQLNVEAKRLYANYVYPSRLNEELKKSQDILSKKGLSSYS